MYLKFVYVNGKLLILKDKLKHIHISFKQIREQYYLQHCQKHSICVAQKGSIYDTSFTIEKKFNYAVGQYNCHLLYDNCQY